MKKISIISVIICVLLLGILAIPVFAAQSATMSVSASSTTVNRGDTITVTVSTSAVENCTSGGFMFSFDKDVFEYVSGSSLSGVSGYMAGVSTAAGNVAGYFMNGNATVQGDIFQITLKVKETAALGTYTISGTPSLTATDGSVSCSAGSARVTVACKHSFTKEDTTYLKSAATCTSPAIYYRSCTTCGAKGTDTFEYGAKVDHSYTRKVTTDAYKKSGATCTTKAVYYYCCETCDAKGTTTYESGSTLSHSYTKKVTTDTYKKSGATCTEPAIYYYCCATCDAKGTTTYEDGNKLGHTGGTATCTTQAKCTRCNELYGNTLEHVYTDQDATATYLKSGATCTSKAVYYKNCATCDKAGTTTFEYGEKKAHTNTQKVDDLYLKSAATCTAKAVYYESCSVCGEKGTATFEAGEAPSHNYKTTWSSDASSHWHECSKCGDKKDTVSHTAGAAATEYTAQTCTVCGYVITPALGHTHNYASTWSSNSSSHWYACSGCSSQKNKESHDYENDCDTKCDTCGYTRTTNHSYGSNWTCDSENHWHECSSCGNKINEGAHMPGADATETTDQVCTVCGYVIKEALGHTHNHNTMNSDESNHWNECACGDKTGVAAHTWDDGVVTKEATANEEGTKTYTCSACGLAKEETIAISNGTDKNDGLPTGAIIGIVVGSIVVVGALGYFVIKKKRC